MSILCKAIPMNVSLKRAVALVIALAKLHNFCINEADGLRIPPVTEADDLAISLRGGVPLQMSAAAGMALPRQLLGGGHHFADMNRSARRVRESEARQHAQENNELLPRERLHNLVQAAKLSRPVPTGRHR
jgi:hypothetical protein